MRGTAPSEGLRASVAPPAVEAEQLEPPDEVGCHRHCQEPAAVRLEARKGHAAEPRILQALDVVLDVRVRAHQFVELDRVAVAVGEEAPVAELERGKEAALGPLVRLAANDERVPVGRPRCQ